MIGPWIHALWRRGRKLSDIEYLSIKEFEGKIRTATGQLAATGTLATLTATAGKDMYLAGAKISCKWNQAAGGALQRIAVDLTINGTIVETGLMDTVFGSGIFHSENYEFVCKGLKVAATQIIKLELSEMGGGSDGEVAGNLIVFEETTGDSPAIS